jgi:hypothetical protein
VYLVFPVPEWISTCNETVYITKLTGKVNDRKRRVYAVQRCGHLKFNVVCLSSTYVRQCSAKGRYHKLWLFVWYRERWNIDPYSYRSVKWELPTLAMGNSRVTATSICTPTGTRESA